MTRTRALILIVLVAVPALFFGLGKRALWNPVEPRYAGICAELADGGNWLVPTYNQRVYDQKPALFFWLGATALSLSDDVGARHFLVRLPSALGGLLLVLGTWFFAFDLLDKQRALLAAFLALTCWISFWSSRFCHMDTLFAASLTWSLCFARRYSRESASHRKRFHFLMMALCLFLGLMLKGPAIFVFVLATFLVLTLITKDKSVLGRSGIHKAIPFALSLAALWFIPAWREAGGSWARALVYDAGVQHLVDATNSSKHTAIYYPTVLMVLLAPWSFFLPALLTSFWRRRHMVFSDNAGAIKFVVAWALGILIVLYSGTTYRSRYLIPLVPPFAIMMAEFLSAEFAAGRKRSWTAHLGVGTVSFLLLVMGLSFLAPTSFTYILPAESVRNFYGVIAEQSFLARFLGLAVALLACRAFFCACKDRPRSAFATIVAAIVLSFVSWASYGAPAMDALRGDAKLIATIRANLSEDVQFVAIESYARRESTEGFFYFELGRRLESVADDARSIETLYRGAPCLLLIRERDLKRIGSDSLNQWSRIGETTFGRHRIWLLKNTSPNLRAQN